MRLLMATDQPFWHARGGAHQRIRSLWAALQRQLPAPPADSAIFYLGDPNDAPPPHHPDPLGRIIAPPHPARRSTRSDAGSTTRPPAWRRWLPWLPKSPLTRASKPAGIPADTAAPPGLTLADYRWPWVASHFRQALRDHRPDVVLLEYVTMTYLIGMATPHQRQQILWVVDSHDCLSQRQEQFAALDQPHWLQISEAEEAHALGSTDLVIAIQDAEARWFAPRIAPTPVVVAGHAPDMTNLDASDPDVTEPPSLRAGADAARGTPALVVGCLASDNFPNRHAVCSWLTQVAESLVDLPVRFCFAGTLCHALQTEIDRGLWSEPLVSRIRCLGPITHIAEFYRQVDVVINPVQIGTGLKIKSVEALAHGRPLLTSPHSAGDLPTKDAGVVICDAPADWRLAIESLVQSPGALAAAREKARNYSQQQLAPSTVYRELVEQIHARLAAKQSS
jgi:hypothetical protein